MKENGAKDKISMLMVGYVHHIVDQKLLPSFSEVVFRINSSYKIKHEKL